jgi:uncharacterized protein involved in outer membrane biogenesis
MFRNIALTGIALLAISVLLLFTLDLGFLRSTVENQVQQATGRDFSINKGLSIRLGRDLVIRAEGLQLGNPEWAGENSFASAANLYAVIDPRSLWKGPPVIRQIELDGLAVSLLQNEAEQVNWEFITADTAEEPVSDQLAFLIESITITDASIDFNSPRLDQPIAAVITLLEESVEADGLVHASLGGELNNRQMQLSATVGPYMRLPGGDDIRLEGSGSFGNISVSGSADFDNLWNPQKPVIKLQVDGPDFQELTDMLGIEGLGSGAISFTAVSAASDDGLAARIDGRFGEFSVDIDSEIHSLEEISGASFHARISGPNFGRIARLGGSDGWPEAPFEIDTHLQRPDQALQIDQFELMLAGASINLKGNIPAFPEMPGAELALRISGRDLAPFQDATGLQSLPAGAFSINGDVKTDAEGLTSLDMEYEIPLARGVIKGILGDGKGVTGPVFRLTADGSEVRAIGEMLGIPGLAAEPWSALLDVDLSNPAFHDLSEASFSSAGFSVELQGRVGAVTLEKDTDLQFSVNGDRLTDFQVISGEDISLPDQPFSVTGRATATPGAWELKDISGAAGSTRFKLSGALGQGESLAGSDLSVEASGTDLGRLFEIPGEARLPDGPYSVSFRIGLEEDRLRIGQLAASAGQSNFKLDADLPWPLDMSRGQFSLQASGANITRILPELAGLDLDSEDYEIIAAGGWGDGQIFIAQGHARIGDSSLSAQGKLDLPPNLSATDFQIEMHSPDLSRLGTVDGVRWGTIPLHLNSSFTGTATRFLMEQFQAQLGDSSVQGDFMIDFEPDVPLFDMTFTSSSLNLKRFQVAPEEETEAEEPADKGARFIPDLAFPLEALTRAEGKFTIIAERVILRKITLQESTLSGDLRNGALHIEEMATDGYQGRLVSSFDLEPEADGTARLSASVHSEELILNMTGQSDQDKQALPAFNINIDLEARGAGLRQAAGALNGTIRIDSPGGRVKNIRSKSEKAMFLAELVSTISPSASRQEVINISCIAAAVDVRDGMVLLDPGIALQSDKLNVFAAGKINLDSENVDVSFRTETRKAVNISASELVSPYVKLSGTLSKPSIALDAKGTLLSGGAAYLSGGLSILAKKALDQLGGTRDPCAEYLEKEGG